MATLAACVTLFLSIALHQLYLPGLYYDEALDLAPMLDIMRGAPTLLLRGIGVTIGGYAYPVMLMDYMGSLNGYVTLPFMLALGPGVVAARLSPILFSAVTIILAYAVARAWFGQTAGLVTALLLAANPSFVWFSRQGITVTSIMTVFSLGSWLLLDRWRRRVTAGEQSRQIDIHARLTLLAAGVLLGLGLWAKIIFLWWIAVLSVMGLVWFLTLLRPILSATRGSRLNILARLLQAAPWIILGFLIGAAPLVYFNLAGLAQGQPPATIDLLFRSLLQPTQYGIDNSNLAANLNKRLQDFAVFLNGSYFWFLAPVPYGNVYAVPAFLGAAIAGSALAFRRPEWRKWAALMACIAAYLPISAFTVSDLWATHFFLLFPLPQMAVAVAAVWLAEAVAQRVFRASLPRAALSALLASALIALPFSRDLWVNAQYHQQLGIMGGSGRFSDAIYTLAGYLEAEGIVEPVALDWGIEKNVRVLTGDRVRPVELFGFSAEADDTFRQRAQEMLADRSRRYIVLWDQFAVYNRRLAFTQIAEGMGRNVVEIFIAHERSGLPVYIVLQAQ
ncbi:MAG: ArnT family glycosyltransferase [Anaerolineae bacterium]